MRAVLLAVAVLAALPATAYAAPALKRHVPILLHDSGEAHPVTAVQALAGRVPGIRAGRAVPTAYGRRRGPWLQYWLFFARDDQARSPLGTGTHVGDWELVQYRLAGGRVVEAIYGQHDGAERCGLPALRFRRGRPVVFVARGSHAAYFARGLRDRIWPDPNDAADGRGLAVRPRFVRLRRARQRWLTWTGRWGRSRAGWAPGEEDSPRGPAFQPAGAWSDPAGWAAAAGPCMGGRCNRRGECDQSETVMAASAAALGLLGAIGLARRRLRAR